MSAILEAESTLTHNYRTTIPKTVRRALRLARRDKIRYAIRQNGEVVLTRVDAIEDADPVLARFLGFLAREIAKHPEHVQGLDPGLPGVAFLRYLSIKQTG